MFTGAGVENIVDPCGLTCRPFRNTEFFTGGRGKINTVEVYFGSKIGRVENIR
jgi:hypothetical protein